MTVDQNTYVDSVFFVATKDLDWMATVFKQGDGNWEAEYRFRYYAKDENGETGGAFDGKDRKAFYTIKAKDNSDETGAKMREAFTTMTKLMADKLNAEESSVVPVEGNSEKFMKVLSEQPWAHMQTLKKSPWD